MATESIFNTDILIREIDFLNQKSSENLYFVPQGWGICVNESPQGWGFCCIIWTPIVGHLQLFFAKMTKARQTPGGGGGWATMELIEILGGFILAIDQYKIPKGRNVNKHIVNKKHEKVKKSQSKAGRLYHKRPGQKHRKINNTSPSFAIVDITICNWVSRAKTKTFQPISGMETCHVTTVSYPFIL